MELGLGSGLGFAPNRCSTVDKEKESESSRAPADSCGGCCNTACSECAGCVRGEWCGRLGGGGCLVVPCLDEDVPADFGSKTARARASSDGSGKGVKVRLGDGSGPGVDVDIGTAALSPAPAPAPAPTRLGMLV